MLLRSISKHVKDQNWFAVALDFFIVVVGILIAFQITNWNEGRQERQDEARIIERLGTDVASLMIERADARGFSLRVRDDMTGAVRVLFEIDDKVELSAAECFAVVISDVRVRPPDDLPIIEELLSTGRIDIIRDAGIRHALSNFIRARDQARENLMSSLASDGQLSAAYPELMTLTVVAGENNSKIKSGQECSVADMRLDQGFLNKFAENHARYLIYFRDSFENVDPDLATLQAELERVLSPHAQK